MIIFDSSLWVSLAFLSLVALGGRKGWYTLCHYLDQRALTIHQDIQEAQKLKEDAQSTLDHALRRRQQMQQRSEEILTHNEAIINSLKAQIEQELNTYLKQEEQALTTRLEILQKQILKELRQKIIKTAFKSAEQNIITHTNTKIDDVLFQKGIEKIYSLSKKNL